MTAFRILGPLEVSEGGRQVEVTGGKQRALLAVLLLNANRVVAVDRIVDALWEDDPPETAAKAVQVYVSQLRKLLGRDRLLTKAPGYVLRVDEGDLDLNEFQRLVDERSFREALDLWRGPPLAEFGNSAFARSDVARLEELRLACLEQRIDADLDAGRHVATVSELEVLADEHPLRQHLRAQLMLALYRSGREAEALEAYQRARRALTDELGMEPSRELRELQQAILRQDPTLDLVEASESHGAESSGASGSFVGRERELEALVGGLDDAFAGRGRLFLVVGEPGIGKSRLCEELIRRARARQARVLVGRCWEAGGAPAYWPWVQLLRAYIREAGSDTLRAQLSVGTGDLAQLLPELRELFAEVPPPDVESESARFRLFESVAALLKSAASRQPVVLVLDDLHAADEPSLLLLRFVAREIGDSRLLVVGGYRDVDPTPSAALRTALVELAREPVTRTIALAGLSEDNVERLIELVSGDMPRQRLLADIYEETEGNPLFVGEIIQLLAAEGKLGADAPRIVIPRSVQDVIARRLGHLSDECGRVLVLASVLGREFRLDVLARVADVSEDDLVDTLDEAMAARILRDVPGADDLLRFAHVLIRDTLYEGLTRVRRGRLHRRVLEALEALEGDRLDPHLAELAHHAIAGGTLASGISYARRAGDHARASLAYEEAARLYSAARDALARTEARDEATRCDLTMALGEAQLLAGDRSGARESLLAAADVAKAIGSRERLARAALGYAGWDLWGARAEVDPMLVQLLDDALDGWDDGDSILRAMLLARLASSLRGSVDRGRRASLADRAVELADATGDRGAMLFTLGSRIAATRAPQTIADARSDGVEVVRIATELGDANYEFSGRENLFYVAWTLGDRKSVVAELDAMARLSVELREPSKQWSATACQAMLSLADGQLAAAEELTEAAFRIGERSSGWIAVVGYRLQTFARLEMMGQVDGYDQVLRRSVNEFPGYQIVECALASACCQLGRAQEGAAILESVAADGFIGLDDDDWLVNACLLADVSISAGDMRQASLLYELLMPFAHLHAFAQMELDRGAVARTLGCLATTLGRHDEADDHFAAAIEMNEKMRARPWVARTQEDQARMLLDRAMPADRGRARELLDAALMTYRELGMHGPLARAERLVLPA